MRFSVDLQRTSIIGSRVLQVRLVAVVVTLVGVNAKVVQALI
jgi:hypothetical protein